MNYQEILPSGGVLHLGERHSYVSYSFQGPDERYQSQELRIPGERLMEYANALAENYDRYLEAKRNEEVFTEKEGLLGMKIRLGLCGGVRMGGNLKLIRSTRQLNRILCDLKEAAERIKEWKL